MQKGIRVLISTGLCAALLFGASACGQNTEEKIEVDPGSTGSAATETAIGGEETIVLESEQPQSSVLPTVSPDSTPVPVEQPTEIPATPQPTRAPMEGDIEPVRFPDHDTGENADWSYQSDELRIAITRNEDDEDRLVYYVADIWIRNVNSFRMGFGNGKFNSGREEPEDFATREHAIFAVNGTMNSGLVIHNGEQVKKNVENSDIAFRSGVLIIYRDGSVKTINRAKKQTYNYKKENAEHGGIWHALQFGPILVQDGEIQSGLKKNERHPRTIFGYVEPGHYIIVTVDGRTKKSIGITEKEMAELMQSLGCTDAMNMDGGNSAVMMFMGEMINVQSGSGRNVVDLLAFAEYDADGNAPALSEISPDRIRKE